MEGLPCFFGCSLYCKSLDCPGVSLLLSCWIVCLMYSGACFQLQCSFVFVKFDFVSRLHSTFETGTPFWKVLGESRGRPKILGKTISKSGSRLPFWLRTGYFFSHSDSRLRRLSDCHLFHPFFLLGVALVSRMVLFQDLCEGQLSPFFNSSDRLVVVLYCIHSVLSKIRIG